MAAMEFDRLNYGVLEENATSFIDPRFFEYWEPPKIICSSGCLAVARSITAVKYCPTRYTIFQPYNNMPTAVGIFDTKGATWQDQWVVRLDKPHPGRDYHHMNVNKRLTGVADPHVKIPKAVVDVAGKATTAVKYIGYGALVLSVCEDANRLGCSIKKDAEENGTLVGKRTVKTGVTMAASWGGGFGGAALGSSGGAYVGGAIGALFGGVGAVPGAAIGGILGTLVGGLVGGVAAPLGAEAVTDAVYDNIRSKKEGFIFKVDNQQHLCIIQNATPQIENESQRQYLERLTKNWQNMLTNIAIIAYECSVNKSSSKNISFSLLTRTPMNENCVDILSDLAPWCGEHHTTNGQIIYESKFKTMPVERPVIHKICSSLAFSTSKILFYIQRNENAVETSLLRPPKRNDDFHSFLGKQFPSVDKKFVLPKIQNEALVMDVTGKALFWLNPSIGTRVAAIVLERVLPSLEIISD